MPQAVQGETFGHSGSHNVPVSKARFWAGTILMVLAILFLLMDSVLHLMKPAPVVEAFARLGYPISLSVALGIIELVCIALYALPLTSIFGAIVLTGYLGGAVATQLRAGSSLFETIFPILVGIVAWVGIWLREDRLRAIFPLRG